LTKQLSESQESEIEASAKIGELQT